MDDLIGMCASAGIAPATVDQIIKLGEFSGMIDPREVRAGSRNTRESGDNRGEDQGTGAREPGCSPGQGNRGGNRGKGTGVGTGVRTGVRTGV